MVSAIYSESVAAKDGRLRVGDQLLMVSSNNFLRSGFGYQSGSFSQVNEESVESMSTTQIINLLRIIRGSICLRLIRRTGSYIAVPEQPEGEQEQELDLPPPPEELIMTPPDTSEDLDVQVPLPTTAD